MLSIVEYGIHNNNSHIMDDLKIIYEKYISFSFIEENFIYNLKIQKEKDLHKFIMDNLNILGTLDISDGEFIELSVIPPNLTEFKCVNNKLTKLPELPKTLEILYCNNNELTELPNLPDSLTVLYC